MVWRAWCNREKQNYRVTDQATRTHVVCFMLVARYMGQPCVGDIHRPALMEEGYIALDLPIDPSASRERRSAAEAALEGTITLRHLFRNVRLEG